MNTAAGSARISGWDIIGKTGTTDADKDSWFCGMSPYATLAIWTGFDYPHTISNTNVATNTFNKVMSSYLSGMEHKDFKFPSNLIEAQYNPYSGLIVSTENVSGKYVGYYTEDNMPSNGGWDGYYDSSDSDNYDDYNYEILLLPKAKAVKSLSLKKAAEIPHLPKARAAKNLSLKKAEEMYLLRELKSVYLEELSAYRQFFIKYIREL